MNESDHSENVGNPRLSDNFMQSTALEVLTVQPATKTGDNDGLDKMDDMSNIVHKLKEFVSNEEGGKPVEHEDIDMTVESEKPLEDKEMSEQDKDTVGRETSGQSNGQNDVDMMSDSEELLDPDDMNDEQKAANFDDLLAAYREMEYTVESLEEAQEEAQETFNIALAYKNKKIQELEQKLDRRDEHIGQEANVKTQLFRSLETAGDEVELLNTELEAAGAELKSKMAEIERRGRLLKKFARRRNKEARRLRRVRRQAPRRH